LIAISGVAVNVHFCGDKVSSISFSTAAKKDCGCKKEAEKKSCCKDEIKQFNNDPGKAEISSFKLTKASEHVLVHVDYFLSRSLLIGDATKGASKYSYSYINKVPRYLRCCVFLI